MSAPYRCTTIATFIPQGYAKALRREAAPAQPQVPRSARSLAAAGDRAARAPVAEPDLRPDRPVAERPGRWPPVRTRRHPRRGSRRGPRRQRAAQWRWRLRRPPVRPRQVRAVRVAGGVAVADPHLPADPLTAVAARARLWWVRLRRAGGGPGVSPAGPGGSPSGPAGPPAAPPSSGRAPPWSRPLPPPAPPPAAGP